MLANRATAQSEDCPGHKLALLYQATARPAWSARPGELDQLAAGSRTKWLFTFELVWCLVYLFSPGWLGLFH